MDNYAERHAGTLRILLAEDEVLIALVVEQVLADRGHQVSVAYDGQEALELVTQLGAPDALITDMRMPRMAGDELICRLRKTHPSLPILVVSAVPAPEVLERLRALGGPIAFLVKPFSLDLVADEIERLAAESA